MATATKLTYKPITATDLCRGDTLANVGLVNDISYPRGSMEMVVTVIVEVFTVGGNITTIYETRVYHTSDILVVTR